MHRIDNSSGLLFGGELDRRQNSCQIIVPHSGKVDACVIEDLFVQSELCILTLEVLSRNCVCRGSGESVVLQWWISRVGMDQWCYCAVLLMCEYPMLALSKTSRARGVWLLVGPSLLVTLEFKSTQKESIEGWFNNKLMNISNPTT